MKNTPDSENNEAIMRKVIRLSVENIDRGGGPFAAAVVREGKILGTGVNTVAEDYDPTAHAEVNAIRKAASVLESFRLDDCILYTSCEPCPMCLGAIYWAGIPEVFYGNSREDATRFGFKDEHIYQETGKPAGDRRVRFKRMLGKEAIEAFKLWDQKSDKIVY